MILFSRREERKRDSEREKERERERERERKRGERAGAFSLISSEILAAPRRRLDL